jgi:hypothetical protein
MKASSDSAVKNKYTQMETYAPVKYFGRATE